MRSQAIAERDLTRAAWNLIVATSLVNVVSKAVRATVDEDLVALSDVAVVWLAWRPMTWVIDAASVVDVVSVQLRMIDTDRLARSLVNETSEAAREGVLPPTVAASELSVVSLELRDIALAREASSSLSVVSKTERSRGELLAAESVTRVVSAAARIGRNALEAVSVVVVVSAAVRDRRAFAARALSLVSVVSVQERPTLGVEVAMSLTLVSSDADRAVGVAARDAESELAVVSLVVRAIPAPERVAVSLVAVVSLELRAGVSAARVAVSLVAVVSLA